MVWAAHCDGGLDGTSDVVLWRADEDVLLKADDGERLAKSAGVPASRVKRPLLTYIEEGFLLSLEDLKGIASRVGAIDDHAHWQSPLPQADGWTKYVEEAASAEKGEYETILLMNTGLYVRLSFPSS